MSPEQWRCIFNVFYCVLQALQELKGKTEEIPCVVGNEEVWTKDIRYQLSVSFVLDLCVFQNSPTILLRIYGVNIKQKPPNNQKLHVVLRKAM